MFSWCCLVLEYCWKWKDFIGLSHEMFFLKLFTLIILYIVYVFIITSLLDGWICLCSFVEVFCKISAANSWGVLQKSRFPCSDSPPWHRWRPFIKKIPQCSLLKKYFLLILFMLLDSCYAPLKMLENQRFSDNLRGYRKRSVTWNGWKIDYS